MPIYSGSTIDEAIQRGLKDLKVSQDEVTMTILEEGKKGFLGLGKKEAEVQLELIETPPVASEEIAEADTVEMASPTINEDSEPTADPVKRESVGRLQLQDDEALKEVAVYLTNITNALKIPTLIRIERQEPVFIFHLESEQAGYLIGKHGKVLNALQYLAQSYIHRVAENKLTIVVNVGDYRERRAATLERLAKNTARKVKETGQPVFLEPMPAFERKQIHGWLTHDRAIATHSEGEEPFRYLVVERAK